MLDKHNGRLMKVIKPLRVALRDLLNYKSLHLNGQTLVIKV